MALDGRFVKQVLAWPAVLLLLGACAAPGGPMTAQLTYETRPEGATLFEEGQSLGMAPQTRTYPLPGQAATVRTPLVTAVWPSGARETFFAILPAGADRVATIERPSAAPGLQADLEHARKLLATAEQSRRRQTEAELREQRRNSDRCRAQQSGASRAVTDDC